MIDGSLIKYYRKKNDLTQAELAHGICSITYLSKVENNKMEASTEVLNELCYRLGIKASLLTNSVGEDVKEALETWNTIMNLGDQKKARELYLKIKADAAGQVHYSVMHLYNLFLFRYYIFSYQLEKADELYPLIKNLNNSSLSPKATYYYYKFLGIYYNNKQRLSDALKSLMHAEKLGEQLLLKDSHLFHLLTIQSMKLNKKVRAILYAQKAIKIYQEELNYERITSVTLILAINYILIDETDLGKDLLFKLIAKDSAKEDDNLKSHIYHNLGLAYYRESDYQSAIKNFKVALQSKRAENVNNVRTIYMLAFAYYKINQPDSARKLINKGKAITLVNTNEDKSYKLRFELLCYLIDEKRFDLDFMDFLKQEAIPYFEKNGDIELLSECYGYLGEAHYQHHQYKPAADCFKDQAKVDKHF